MKQRCKTFDVKYIGDAKFSRSRVVLLAAVLLSTACVTPSSTETVNVDQTDATPFAIACAVVESFYRARNDIVLEKYPLWLNDAGRSYYFNDPATGKKTNCQFSDGEQITWRKMSGDGVDVVTLWPSSSHAEIFALKNAGIVRRHLFSRINGRWVHDGYVEDFIIVTESEKPLELSAKG